MINKNNSSIVISYFIILITLHITNSVFAQVKDSTNNLEQNLPKYIYAHVGIGGNMFEVSSDNMNTAIEPFKVATPIKFGHYFYLNTGFRNIFQLEYRWGNDSNNLFYDETSFPFSYTIKRTTIDTKFDYSQLLFKLNPLFFVSKLNAWAVFVVWGKGDVDYIDDNGDGFIDGTKKIIGIEISKILKYFEMSGSFEKNSMVFKKFNIKGFEPIIKDFDAGYWQFNVKLSIGFGI